MCENEEKRNQQPDWIQRLGICHADRTNANAKSTSNVLFNSLPSH